MICPICNNISALTICPVCGYDESCDYEAHPALVGSLPKASPRSMLLHTYAMALRTRCEGLEARVRALESNAESITALLINANDNIAVLSARLEKLNDEMLSAAAGNKYASANADGTLMSSPPLHRGDVVIMGKYQQLDIEWLVLDSDGFKALLISKNIIDSRVFGNSWVESELREWLNGTFYRTAFTKSEQNRIMSTRLEDFGITDRIFLLSRREFKKYFHAAPSDANSEDVFSGKCSPTAYALKTGAYAASSGYSRWWLRSAGFTENNAACVNTKGNLLNAGLSTSTFIQGVRPAMYIKL